MQKQYIIKSSDDITRILNKGDRVRNKTTSLTYVKADEFKIGISIPKKTGNAVKRNKIKRQVKNIVDGIDVKDKNIHVVLIVREEWNEYSYEENSQQLQKLFNKVN